MSPRKFNDINWAPMRRACKRATRELKYCTLPDTYFTFSHLAGLASLYMVCCLEGLARSNYELRQPLNIPRGPFPHTLKCSHLNRGWCFYWAGLVTATYRNLLRDHPHRTWDMPYLANYPHHWVVVRGGKIYDAICWTGGGSVERTGPKSVILHCDDGDVTARTFDAPYRWLFEWERKHAYLPMTYRNFLCIAKGFHRLVRYMLHRVEEHNYLRYNGIIDDWHAS